MAEANGADKSIAFVPKVAVNAGMQMCFIQNGCTAAYTNTAEISSAFPALTGFLAKRKALRISDFSHHHQSNAVQSHGARRSCAKFAENVLRPPCSDAHD